MKETILLYHIADQDRLHAIQRALLPLGMRIRMVQKEEYLQPVGFLAGVKEIQPGKEQYEGEELEKEMMVMAGLSSGRISILLLVYGLANMIGNMIAGRMLSGRPIRFVLTFPFLLGGVYAVMFFLGYFTVPMAVLILIWGILAGAAANINQYWLATAAPKAPDFANGLFLASTNLGTTIGTSVCGFFLSGLGTQYIILGGIIFIACAFLLIVLRVCREKKEQNTDRILKTA